MKYISQGPKAAPPSSEPTLPKSVQHYIDQGAAEGGRNIALFNAAAQLRDIGYPESVTLEVLAPRARADGLSDSEISTTIRHAIDSPRREPPTGSTGTQPIPAPRRFSAARPSQAAATPGAISEARPVPLPSPIAEGFKALIMAAFEPGDGICTANTSEQDDGRRTPDRGTVRTRDEWMVLLADPKVGGFLNRAPFVSQHGLFLRVNPMKKEGKRTDADVTHFRHVLVEFDKDGSGNSIPKELQFGAILHSGLPITAILDSGNKSVHAWVRVDAANAEEYKQRVDVVYSLFDKAALDPANRNPSRFSRCPQGKRTLDGGELREQKLLALHVGAKSWGEFETLRNTAEFGAPVDLERLLAYDVKNDPNQTLGTNRWLCRGGSVVIVSQSGCGKSSLNMQLAIGWGLDRSDMTFGIPSAIGPLTSLILQAENDEGDLAEAAQGVVKGFKLTEAEIKLVSKKVMWHRITTYAGEEFCRKLEDLVVLHKPDVAWIDPLLNFIGDDISDAAVVTEFCTRWLNPISQRTGVIFALIHHTGKPPQKVAGQKANSTDKAYAGIGSSTLTNWAREVMNLERVWAPEGDPKTFMLTACKRGKRAGMKSFDGDGLRESIFIRHSDDGNQYWVQCAEPPPEVKPKKPKVEKGEGRSYTLKKGGTEAVGGVIDVEEVGEGEEPRPYMKPGPQPNFSPEAEKELRELIEKHGNQPLSKSQRDRSEFAMRHGMSDKTMRRRMAEILQVSTALA